MYIDNVSASIYLNHSAPMNEQQNVSRSASTNSPPAGDHATSFATKFGNGISTNDAPSGVHTYTRESPVATANRCAVGSHPKLVTGLNCCKHAHSSSVTALHTHTVVGWQSFRVARNRPSPDHSMHETPTGGAPRPVSRGLRVGTDAGSGSTTYLAETRPTRCGGLGGGSSFSCVPG